MHGTRRPRSSWPSAERLAAAVAIAGLLAAVTLELLFFRSPRGLTTSDGLAGARDADSSRAPVFPVAQLDPASRGPDPGSAPPAHAVTERAVADDGSQPRPAAAAPRRRGLVRIEGRAFADAEGPFLALGASLFWGLWGYQHDRARLERTLEFLATRGVDYVRVLAVVGPSRGWEDRTADPASSDFDAAVTGLTDLAYDRFGLRIQWTIFGGIDRTPTTASRRTVVDRILAATRGREEKVFLLEVANEWWQTGFGGSEGLAELRALARHLQAETSVPVAVSHPGDDASCEAITRLYGGGVGDVITLHVDRATGGAGGAWRPVRRAWDTWQSCEIGPDPVVSNEPIGPGSSVEEETDPLRLTMAAAMSYLGGFGGYVFHARPGIRGGGAADMARGGPADWWAVPDVEITLGGLRAVRARLPADLPNWNALDRAPGSSGNPFDTDEQNAGADLYCASQGNSFVCLAIDIRRPLRLVARQPIAGEIVEPLTGAPAGRFSLAKGEGFTIDGHRALVITGTSADPQ